MPGCDVSRNLQTDHRNTFGRTEVTKLDDLARIPASLLRPRSSRNAVAT